MTAAGPGAGGEVRVEVDRIRCVGTGLCAATAPDALELGADGRARALRAIAADSEELTEAAEMCPVEAISVRSAATGEQVAPRW
ncbi:MULTISPECIES: ferredoxin [Kitasatospora]|uniref:Ferredoxin n=2 Tax=Kitasatospora TaxID=2063 RepID=A0ABT1J8Q8_9ACTN|nr:ferredoxin [Kitasatospora paracochleata]MCP2313822.1 ferredoxin [Kitasatospora paracochleata]